MLKALSHSLEQVKQATKMHFFTQNRTIEGEQRNIKNIAHKVHILKYGKRQTCTANSRNESPLYGFFEIGLFA